jgi:glycosyltransferase involved in cell wall biosynthesis
MREFGWDGVHIFVPTVYPRDGIGGHVERTVKAQRARGRKSEIFVESFHPATADQCHHVSQLDTHLAAGERNVFIFQTGSGSTLPNVLIPRSEPLVVYHQGLTPIDLMSPWSTESIGALTLGRRQLEELAKRADLGIGSSQHNADELAALGFRRTAMAPVVFDAFASSQSPARPTASRPRVLFVGRITPNKGQHDLIESFAVVRTRVPDAELRLVGSVTTPSYPNSLERLVKSLDLTDSVTFVGDVSDDQLRGEYASADLFCSMSDHEGFGMPLVEAAAAGIPVIAYAVAAVPGTVGSGGILLDSKDPALVATAIERVLTDDALRQDLVAAGHARVAELAPDNAVDALDIALNDLADELTSSTGQAR